MSDAKQCACPEALEPKVECKADTACRLTGDYCNGCSCLALGPGEAAPACLGEEVACLVGPCLDLSATCEAGEYTVGGASTF